MMPSAADADTDGDAAPGSQRLDQWLWFARIVKSRTLAAKLVVDGKLRVNRVRVVKPSYAVKPGDVLTATVHRNVRVLQIKAIGERRGPASEAQALYADLTPTSPVAGPAAEIDAPIVPDGVRPKSDHTQPSPGSDAGRPTKRDRRRLAALRGD